jgi:hypothetical protein
MTMTYQRHCLGRRRAGMAMARTRSAAFPASSAPPGRTSGRRGNSPGKDMTICGGHSTTQPLSPIETNKSAVASLARPVHQCESPPSCDRFYCVRFNQRERLDMGTLDLSLSRTMHQRMHAAAPLLSASSFRRMNTIARRPSPCFLRRCRRGKARKRPLPGRPLHPFLSFPFLALPCRSPKSKSHAHPARGKFRRLRIYRPGPVSFEFQNSAPLF